jgi:hypothetical protein
LWAIHTSIVGQRVIDEQAARVLDVRGAHDLRAARHADDIMELAHPDRPAVELIMEQHVSRSPRG